MKATGSPGLASLHRLARPVVAAVGVVLLLGLGGRSARAGTVDHAAVCRCSPCRDESRCCCMRAAARARAAEETERATAGAGSAEVRLVCGGCEAPGPGATSPRVLNETALVGWALAFGGVRIARGTPPRDLGRAGEGAPRRLDRPPRGERPTV